MSYDFIINKLATDVYEIENFLNTNETELMLDIINSANEEQWYDKNYITDKNSLWYGKSLFLGEGNEIGDSAILKKVDYIFPSYYYCEKEIKISRFKEGDFIQQHRDNDTTPEGYYLGYGLVIYYNDEYDGGELEYPELNIKIKPKKGSALLHGGEVLHGSLPVIGDKTRYFTTIFMRGNDENPITVNSKLPIGSNE